MGLCILTSGIGFGTYIPSVVLMQQLKEAGIDVSMEILEMLFLDEKKERLLENQRRYHNDFKAAKVAMRLPAMKQLDNFDDAHITELIRRWDIQKISYFIVFSGNWQHILEEYGRNHEIHIYCVHMDCVTAPSWQGFMLENERETWLIGQGDELPEEVLYPDEKINPLDKRGQKLLVHGGGWSLGLSNIREKLAEASGYEIRLIDCSMESKSQEDTIQYFGTGEWRVYEDTKRLFPPLYYEGRDINRIDEHYVYRLEKESLAVLTKAGGGTLCESLSGIVPVILTESVAWHEEMNKKKWIKHGFGLSFEGWKESGFSKELLEDCYQKLYIQAAQPKKVLFQEICRWVNS